MNWKISNWSWNPSHQIVYYIFCIYTFNLLITSSLAMEDWETWTKDELEKQMSPSRWNPDKTPEQVIDEYIQDGLKSTKEAKEKIPNALDIIYGSKGQKLDLYGTDLPNSSPIFAFVHGGYWQEGAKEISGGTAVPNHKIGVRTAAIGYTLAPNATIEEIEHEIIDALEFLALKYPEAKIIIGGHSAGGQLAAHLLHQPIKPLSPKLSSQLIGFVLISGVYDLRPLVNTYVNDPLKMTMENALSLSPLQSQTFNPNFNPKSIKIMILVGEYDSPEFKRQSEVYCKKMEAIFPHTEFYLSKADDHFTIIQNLVQTSTQSGSKLNTFLKSIEGVKGDNNNSAGAAGILKPCLSLLSVFMSFMS